MTMSSYRANTCVIITAYNGRLDLMKSDLLIIKAQLIKLYRPHRQDSPLILLTLSHKLNSLPALLKNPPFDSPRTFVRHLIDTS